MIRRGQMKLSFGMIFSIILIIFFIAFAFFAITKFLDFQDTAKLEKFVSDFQTDVDRIWKGSPSNPPPIEYFLSRKVEQICFTDGEFENFIIRYSDADIRDERLIDHINIDGPFCVDAIDGKVKLTLKKDFGEALVTVTE